MKVYSFLMFLMTIVHTNMYSQGQRTQEQFSTLPGNHSGNIINGGLIASDNKNIYFVNMDTTDKGLYSTKLDGTGLKKISDDVASYLNVLEGWIYFSNKEVDENSSGIYKMRIDGSDKVRLSGDNGFYINVVGNWIYYIDWSHETNICKMKTDGSEASILYRGHNESLSTDGNSLFFKKINSPEIYSASFDGKKISQLTTDKVWNPIVLNDFLYFRDDNKGYGIYRMKKDGQDKQLIIKDGNIYKRFIIYNGWIYLNDGNTFKRKKLTGKSNEILFRGDIMEIGVVKNCIFFRSVQQGTNGEQYDKTILRKVSN